MAQNVTQHNLFEVIPSNFNIRNRAIIPPGVYGEGSPRITITVATETAATLTLNTGLVLEISDGTHQVRSEMTASQTVIGDFTVNDYIIATYTFDNNANTVPVFTQSATPATGNSITIGRAIRSGGNIVSIDYSEAPLKTIFVQGGNTTGADMQIGTRDNFDLDIRTNNTDRINIANSGLVTFFGNLNSNAAQTWTLANVANALNIDSNTFVVDALNGRIGIGVAAPDQLLEIESSAHAFMHIDANGTNSQASIFLDASGDGGVNEVIFQKDGVSRGVVGFTHNATAISEKMRFTVNGAERLSILGDGKVGINTSNPSAKFQITQSGGASTDGIRIVNGSVIWDCYSDTSGTLTIVSSGGASLQITDGGHFELGGNVKISTTSNIVRDYTLNTWALDRARISAQGDSGAGPSAGGGVMIFSTANSGGVMTEVARFNQDGHFGIGTVTPASVAILDIVSTTKGVLFPRMTTTQKNAITPIAGLVIYDTTLNTLTYYNGSAWINT